MTKMRFFTWNFAGFPQPYFSQLNLKNGKIMTYHFVEKVVSTYSSCTNQNIFLLGIAHLVRKKEKALGGESLPISKAFVTCYNEVMYQHEH